MISDEGEASLHAAGKYSLNVDPNMDIALYDIRGRSSEDDTQDHDLPYEDAAYAYSLHITPKVGFIIRDTTTSLTYDPVTLTAEPLRLSGTFTYQWSQKDAVGEGYTDIPGTNASAYTFTPTEPGAYGFKCVARAVGSGTEYTAFWTDDMIRAFSMVKEGASPNPTWAKADTSVTLQVRNAAGFDGTRPLKWYQNTTASYTGGTMVQREPSAAMNAYLSYVFTPDIDDQGKNFYFYLVVDDRYYSDIWAVSVVSDEPELALTHTATGQPAVKDTDYTYTDFTMTLNKPGAYTLSLLDGVTESGHIFEVAANVSGNVTLTLDNVAMTAVPNSRQKDYRIRSKSKSSRLDVILTGTNTMNGKNGLCAFGDMKITGGGSLAFTGVNEDQSTGIQCNRALEMALGASGGVTLAGTSERYTIGLLTAYGSYLHTSGTMDITGFRVGINVKTFTMAGGTLNIAGVVDGLLMTENTADGLFANQNNAAVKFLGGVIDITTAPVPGKINVTRAVCGFARFVTRPAANPYLFVLGDGMTIVRGGGIANADWQDDATYSKSEWIQAISEGEVRMNGNTLTGASESVRIAPAVMPALTGTVQITGEAKFGSELTAAAINTNNTGTLAYQWKRGGTDILGANAASYTPVEADIGQVLTCEATSTVETGAISASTGRVELADGSAAPAGLAGVAPSAVGGADGKILRTTAAMEYSVAADFAGAENCGDPETGSLRAGTYYVRYKKTATHKASERATVVVGEGAAGRYAISVSASPAAGGTVTGGGTYDDGATVTVEAIAAANHRFVNWTEGGYPVATDARYSFGAAATRTLVAVFAPNANPPATLNTIAGIAAGQVYPLGATVTFTAVGGGANNRAPYAGDGRWEPTAWETNPHGDFASGYTQRFSTAGMSLGAHTLTVTFTQQRYDGAAWTALSPAVTDQKSVSFLLVAEAEGTPAKETLPPETGDGGAPLWWWGLCLLAGAGMAVIALSARRRA